MKVFSAQIQKGATYHQTYLSNKLIPDSVYNSNGCLKEMASAVLVQISLSRKLISERSVGTRRARQSMNGAIRLAGWSSTVGKYRILQHGRQRADSGVHGTGGQKTEFRERALNAHPSCIGGAASRSREC